MRPTKLVTVVVLGVMGCVDPARDPAPVALVVEPAELSVTVIDGVPVVQAYTATAIDADGIERDVTGETTFALTDGAYGQWSASALRITGNALGPARVVAAHGDLRATAGLTVYARLDRRDYDVSADVAAQFERAAVDSSCAPAISYPEANVVLPRNLGDLDVQWTDARDDLFEVSLATSYLEVRLYTRQQAESGWTKLAANDWNRLAAQRESIELKVTGMVASDQKVACRSASQQVFVTDQAVAGSVFYANVEGIMRIDTAHPSVGTTPAIPAEMWEATIAPLVGTSALPCYSCLLSADGSRFAASSGTKSAIYDFAAGTVFAPTDGDNPQRWDFASFDPRGTKLVTSHAGILRLISDGGMLLAELEPPANTAWFDPQFSPDGRAIAYVASTGFSATTGASIVVRSFEADTNTFGVAQTIVPLVAGTANYYPAWSPDGEWVVFTRATGWGTLDTEAAIWIVKADGSEPPIQLTQPTASLDAHARISPMTMSMTGERMYYVVFESQRAFGTASGSSQLWAMPFYPDRNAPVNSLCTVGATCTGTRGALEPAFRLPEQPLGTDNRLLQWAEN